MLESIYKWGFLQHLLTLKCFNSIKYLEIKKKEFSDGGQLKFDIFKFYKFHGQPLQSNVLTQKFILISIISPQKIRDSV